MNFENNLDVEKPAETENGNSSLSTVSRVSWTVEYEAQPLWAPPGTTLSILPNSSLLGFWWANLMLILNTGGCGGQRDSPTLKSGSLIPVTCG